MLCFARLGARDHPAGSSLHVLGAWSDATSGCPPLDVSIKKPTKKHATLICMFLQSTIKSSTNTKLVSLWDGQQAEKDHHDKKCLVHLNNNKECKIDSCDPSNHNQVLNQCKNQSARWSRNKKGPPWQKQFVCFTTNNKARNTDPCVLSKCNQAPNQCKDQSARDG